MLILSPKQDQRTVDSANHRRNENPYLSAIQCRCYAKSEIGNEQRHGESDPAEQPDSDDLSPGNLTRQRGKSTPNSDPRKSNDPNWFSNYKSRHNPDRNAISQVANRLAIDCYAGIGQSEQRHNRVRNPGR